MKIKQLLILGLVLLGFTYCSSDDVVDGSATGNETAGNLKMEIAIKMPTGANTRSATGATGIEVGTAEENKVNSVLIAIFGSDGNYKASHTSELADAATGDKFYTTAEFKIPSGLNVDDQFYVYAFVNPYEGLAVDLLDNKFTAKTTLEATIDAITKKGVTRDNFFMSNAETAQLTPKITANNISGAPLQVGVSVQRAVARFDYVAKTVENTYTVGESSTVSVKITGYKLLNNSKSFFNLKRVSADGVDGEVTIGGTENTTNYVVDTDWAAKKTSGGSLLANFFNYMGKTKFADLATYNDLASTKTYAVENTTPKTEVSSDGALVSRKGLATAVAFKGELIFPGSESDTITQPVYVWNNKFYGIFANLPQAIQDIVGEGETVANKRAELASAGVTGYSNGGVAGAPYPVYYVYYNRHNDNSQAQVTGPMEFAVVRNNIYKLTIDKLSKFGHPNDPELDPEDTDNPTPPNPDPTPEDPTDPIESADLYMQVTATVLDWTVRQNNIEF